MANYKEGQEKSLKERDRKNKATVQEEQDKKQERERKFKITKIWRRKI